MINSPDLARHKDDGEGMAFLSQLGGQFKPVHVGHLKIGQKQIYRRVPDSIKRLEGVVTLGHLVVEHGNEQSQHSGHGRLIVHDEHVKGIFGLREKCSHLEHFSAFNL